ncbi:MAG: right-handed parallel beta-helix repeat-containing protein [Planctomycetota bacterium]
MFILARASVHGGDGADAGPTYWSRGDGGDGADAILARNADILLLGSEENIIQGGDGGDAATDYWYEYGCGGNGGNGFTGDSAVASLVTLSGGQHGHWDYDCYGSPQDGLPWQGDVTLRDDLPYLDVAADLRPGRDFEVTIRAARGAEVRLLDSDKGGFVDLPGVQGPPLSVLANGSWFAELGRGLADSQGKITFTVSLEDGLHMEGFPIHLQAFVVDSMSGMTYLTNAALRVVADSSLEDCNHNGNPDNDDIGAGLSEDCDGNGVPDECQDTSADCNHNGQWDTCDIAYGYSLDLNGNGVPDECEGYFYYVDDDAPGDPGPGNPDFSDPLEDGSSDHPFDAIQEAVDVTVHGNTVVIRPGIYRGSLNRNIDTRGRSITVVGECGPESTIIDCEADGHGFFLHSSEGPGTEIAGLSVSNSLATWGGAIHLDGASPTIRACVLRANTAGVGAGLYCTGHANPTIQNCDITDNIVYTSDHYISGGGGIFLDEGAGATVVACNFLRNSVRYMGQGGNGGAMYLYRCRQGVVIQNCVFSQNSADHGGGLSIYGRAPTLANCVFVANEAHWGGAVNSNCPGITFQNVTMVANEARYWGGGLYCYRQSLANGCILANNTADVGSNIYVAGTDSALEVSYGDVVGGDATVGGDGTLVWGPGNIDEDPRFEDLPGGDIHLRLGSPCINTGDPGFVPGPDERDIDGDPRLIGHRVDMGADESRFGLPDRLGQPKRIR